MAKKKKTRVKPKLTPEQLAEMGRLPNGHFAKGNKIAQVYPDGFFELALNEFDTWLFESVQDVGEEGTNSQNIWMIDFYRNFRETFGVSFLKVIRSMQQQDQDLYQEYLDMKEVMGENLIKLSAEGKLKENSVRFYLNSRYNWSEKSETKNENINQDIVWKETKTYDAETIDYEEENDE